MMIFFPVTLDNVRLALLPDNLPDEIGILDKLLFMIAHLVCFR